MSSGGRDRQDKGDAAAGQPPAKQARQEEARKKHQEVDVGELPSGWRAYRSSQTGQVFYYNRETKARQWDRPSATQDQDRKAAAPPKEAEDHAWRINSELEAAVILLTTCVQDKPPGNKEATSKQEEDAVAVLVVVGGGEACALTQEREVLESLGVVVVGGDQENKLTK